MEEGILTPHGGKPAGNWATTAGTAVATTARIAAMFFILSIW